MIEILGHDLSLPILLMAGFIAGFAGFVKGAVGFAMPALMISGLGSIMPAEVAIAALLVPAVLLNFWQALRGGWHSVAVGVRRYARFITLMLICLVISAQLVVILPRSTVYLALGMFVSVFGLIQLSGWQPIIAPDRRLVADVGLGIGAGVMGGFSGVWGPPTVMYLSALEVPKVDHVRMQGVVYSLGAVALALAHVRSGLLNGETAVFSAWFMVPCTAGMALGLLVQDRLDQARFRRATLIVLILAGANLIRRGLT